MLIMCYIDLAHSSINGVFVSSFFCHVLIIFIVSCNFAIFKIVSSTREHPTRSNREM